MHHAEKIILFFCTALGNTSEFKCTL